MAKRFLILMLALGLSAAAPAARAQTPAAAPAERNDIDRFAAEYTRTVILGVVAGGVLMNTLVGGGRATLAGAWPAPAWQAGSSSACRPAIT